jgi:hypothetical protein
LHRSTLCDWLGACADLLRPLYDLMVSTVLQSGALHTDDTTVKMQEPVTHRLRTARLWVYLGDAAHPYNVFDFTLNRKRDGPERRWYVTPRRASWPSTTTRPSVR